MNRRSLVVGWFAAVLLAGCSSGWTVDYDNTVDPSIAKSWHVHGVDIAIPDSLTATDENTYAPNADIVWHGEPRGDRRAQVRAILKEGISRGARSIKGPRGVRIAITLRHFHAVTPAAVAKAPGAVHNISYVAQVFDDRTGEALTSPQVISADIDAYVGNAAVIAAVQGQSQRVRIVDHLDAVTRGWLGTGPDIRGTFSGVGR